MSQEKAIKPKKQRKPLSSKTMSIIYIVIIGLCTALLITLVILTANRLQKNKELKAQEQAIQEEYREMAERHENLNDPDYAEVYFNENNMYIPSKDIIVEYRP